jgi:hypothetical protein
MRHYRPKQGAFLILVSEWRDFKSTRLGGSRERLTSRPLSRQRYGVSTEKTVGVFLIFERKAKSLRMRSVSLLPKKANVWPSLPIQRSGNSESAPDLLPEESPDGVDLTLIRWTLSLMPLQRLELLQDWVDGLAEIRRGRIAED